VFACPDLVETPDGDLLLPYQGYVFPHKYPRGAWSFAGGMARWPHGRLAALEADAEGAFQTVAFVAPGATLRINAVTEDGGSIRVAIDGIEGRRFEDCDPIVGDQPWSAVTWRGERGMRTAAGTAIVLRVRLDRSAIYGFQFDD
jgi:hypothetical protein